MRKARHHLARVRVTVRVRVGVRVRVRVRVRVGVRVRVRVRFSRRERLLSAAIRTLPSTLRSDHDLRTTTAAARLARVRVRVGVSEP